MARILLKLVLLIFILALRPNSNAEVPLGYTASIIGLEEFPELEGNAKKLSQLLNPDTDFSPGSEGVLRDILRDDIVRIKAYLESYGFYDVKIFPEIERGVENNYTIIIHVDAAERYTINHINILVNNKNYTFDKKLLSARQDSPVINELILRDKNAIALVLKKNGYASVEILEEIIDINHDALFADIQYSYKTGPQGKFGGHKINGLQTIQQAYIEKFIQWSPGELYTIEKVNETERLLLDTGLFEAVLITAAEPSALDEFTLSINLTEGKPKHLQFNVYGNTALSSNQSDGYEIGCVPKYVHDNIAGSNEKFEINTILSNAVQDVNVSLRKPHMYLFNATGRAFFSGERRTYDAYSRWGIDGGGGFDYKITPYTLMNLGIIFEKYSLERQTDFQKNHYDFFGFPMAFRIDMRENKIFSDSGVQLDASWTPYVGSKYTLHQFALKGTCYLPIIDEYFILAGWGRWECLSGISFQDSPMDKRVYLGGSQTLRGYAKDALGNATPLPKNHKKDIYSGGLSGVGFGLEPRFRVYNDFWGSVFCDAGRISETENVFKEIKSTSDLYFDVGVSVFYFTDFGPVRLDVAYPIAYPAYDKLGDKRKEFKFYISFGQAF